MRSDIEVGIDSLDRREEGRPIGPRRKVHREASLSISARGVSVGFEETEIPVDVNLSRFRIESENERTLRSAC